MSPMSIEATVAALFPIHSRLYSLELIDPDEAAHGLGEEPPRPIGHNDRGDLIVTVRLSVWDGRSRGRVLECVLESDAVLVLAEDLGDPRLLAYLSGWREAVRAVLESHDGLESAELGLEPRDLFSPEVVELRRPRTAAEFCGEFLVSGRRLGRLLRS